MCANVSSSSKKKGAYGHKNNDDDNNAADSKESGMGLFGLGALVTSLVGGTFLLARSMRPKKHGANGKQAQYDGPPIENPSLPVEWPLLRCDRTLGLPYATLYKNNHILHTTICYLGWVLERILDTYYRSNQSIDTIKTLEYDDRMEVHYGHARHYLAIIQVEVIARFKDATSRSNRTFEDMMRMTDLAEFRGHPMMQCLLCIRSIRTNIGEYRRRCCHNVADTLGRVKIDLAVPVVHEQSAPYTHAEPSVKRQKRERSYVIKNRLKQQGQTTSASGADDTAENEEQGQQTYATHFGEEIEEETAAGTATYEQRGDEAEEDADE